MSRYDDLAARWDATMMVNYGTPALAVASGHGSTVVDLDGRSYLDLVAGIAVSALGHAHPALVEAVSRQVATVAHTSNLAMHEPGVALAERLVELLGGDGRVFLCNDGTTANEAAIKIAKRHGGTERTRFVAADKGFHGRSLGALALTGKAAIRKPFGPPALDVTFVPYGDAAALAAAVDHRTAAVFLEPTQGEAGVVPSPEGYLAAARAACDSAGALLVLDEVQAGIGRTGAWFGHTAHGVRPDVVTLAKGLGGGLPIGACIALGAAGSLLVKGDHGSTFGGNPIACAAALAVLDTIEHDGLLAEVRCVGTRLADGLRAVPGVAAVRGTGLWLGVVLEPGIAAPAVEVAARAAGFLVNAVGPQVLRLAPPLVLTADEVDGFLQALPGLLASVAAPAESVQS